MKKILLLMFFYGYNTFAQDISPYYPAKQGSAYRGNEPTQLTYYDSMFVQGLIPNFLSNRMGMTQISVDGDKIIKQVYQDGFSNGKLIFELHTEPINSKVDFPEIVKSIKITGTKDRVIAFFIEYWGTKIDWDPKKSDVERLQMQDVIKFYFNNGKPYITITNSTYKTTKEFEDHFNKLLAENPSK